MTRLLIAVDRWPSRSRKRLLASDEASLLNAVMGQVTDAVGTDNLLRKLEYKCALPPTAEQMPALGDGTWGEVLERLIQNAPPELYSGAPATNNDTDFRGILPNIIECCLNPASVLLIWLGPDGITRKRIEVYGPTRDDVQKSQPYGQASWLIRKSFMNSNMIVLAGQILRDSSPQFASPENETAATLPGEAAAREPGPMKAPGSPNTRKAMRALSLASPIASWSFQSPRRRPMDTDKRIPLTEVMAVLRALTDDQPNGGYGKLYRAVLDGRLPTHRRGAQHDIDRDDLPLAARIVGVNIASARVAA